MWILTRPVKRYGGYSDDGLLEPYEENGEFPIGTVFYNEKPVEKINNPYWYDCFVRVAWNNLHWNVFNKLKKVGKDIENICGYFNKMKMKINRKGINIFSVPTEVYCT